MDNGSSDKCVLITGASGGIGMAVAEAFARQGAKLALHGHSHVETLDEFAKRIDTPSLIVSADLREEKQVDGLFDDVVKSFVRIDTVVVNAGIWIDRDIPLHEMSLGQWHETVETDLTSAFLTCRAFLRHLAETPRESASIVLVGSTAALFGEAGHADYAAAKAGMVYGLTHSLKNEIVKLAPRGRVNCVCPGWTRTPLVAERMDAPGVVDRVYATAALRKIAAPSDVANAIVFLASERLAGHITGAILPVAGGMEGRLLNPVS